MKFKKIVSTIAAILSLSANGIACCDDGLSYEDTAKSINETMASSISAYRKENYGYIKLDKCRLDYNVSGTYPAGTLYNIKYSDIDFSSLNYQNSKTGNDYTAFIILNFNNYLYYKANDNVIRIRTVVINVSDDESAQTLFKAFLHLGELCGAKKGPS